LPTALATSLAGRNITQRLLFITFCVSRRRREMYTGHARLRVSVLLCVSMSLAAFPQCMDPDVTLVSGRGPPSCALLSGFAIDARVLLL